MFWFSCNINSGKNLLSYEFKRKLFQVKACDVFLELLLSLEEA
jgi:hypothetical protein